MPNIILSYRPYAATPSLGSWQGALPLSNALTADTAEVARSVSAATAATQFKLDFGAQRRLKVLAIRNINASQACRYRVRVFQDSGMATTVYDSGWIDVFPSDWSIETPWESPNFWTGDQAEWTDEERRPSIYHVFPNVVAGAALRVEFDDTGNPAGYIQFDRVFAGEFWQPGLNYTYSGNGLGFVDQTDVETSVNGVKSFGRKIAPRSFSFGFDYLDEAEAFAAGYDLNRWAGRDREVLVIPNPEAEATMMTRSFIGRMSRMDRLAQVACGYAAVAYDIEEVL